jgi:hypothetical protein
MKSKVVIRKTIILVIAFLFVFGISLAVIAEEDMKWDKDFEKEFGDSDYLNQRSWESEIENKAEVIQKGDKNRASIKQNGLGNNALIVQQGNFNNTSITQSGNSNLALIKQLSDNNSALINQGGTNNQAVIIQN